MIGTWPNPEFLRYWRAELRPRRVGAAAAIVAVLLAGTGLTAWSVAQGRLSEFFGIVYTILLVAQFAVLGAWSAGTCAEAISRERALKTYDFLRTTSLSAFELMIGKLIGSPVMAYCVMAWCLPFTVVAGLLAGYGPTVLLATYVLLVLLALFAGMIGLLISLLTDKSSTGGAALLVLLIQWISAFWTETAFPGFAGLSVVPALLALHGKGPSVFALTEARLQLFGWPVHPFWITVVLLLSLGAWLGLIIRGNLKKDIDQIRLFTRQQAVGLAAFANLLAYAFLDRSSLSGHHGPATVELVRAMAVVLNVALAFVMGVGMLVSHERLKAWYRGWRDGRLSYLAEEGLPWPWLLPPVLIAYGALILQAYAIRQDVPMHAWRLGDTAIQILVWMVFVLRDVLFLQWCRLGRFRRPLFAGVLLIGLYYLLAGVAWLFAAYLSADLGDRVTYLLTPAWGLTVDSFDKALIPWVGLTVVVQAAAVAAILVAIFRRLRTGPAAVALAKTSAP